MSGLGLFGAIVGGGLRGAGEGLTDIAKRYQDRETEQLKQDRVAETNRGIAAETEQRGIRAENRGLLNNIQAKKDELAFNTDPANIKLETDAAIQRKKAELQAQAAKDDYTHNRLPQKLADDKLAYDAKNPYARQEAQDKSSLVQAQIAHTNQQVEELRKKGGDEGVIKYIDSMRNSIKDDEEAYANSYGQNPPDPNNAEEVAKANGLRDSIDQRRELLGSIYLLKFGMSPVPKGAPSSVVAAQKQMADNAKAAARQRLTDEYEQVTNKAERTDISKLSNDELVDAITDAVLENRLDIKKRPMLPLDFTVPGLM